MKFAQLSHIDDSAHRIEGDRGTGNPLYSPAGVRAYARATLAAKEAMAPKPRGEVTPVPTGLTVEDVDRMPREALAKAYRAHIGHLPLGGYNVPYLRGRLQRAIKAAEKQEQACPPGGTGD
jgi:hypothetical protein